MVKKLALVFLLSSFFSSVYAAGLSASVDRNPINENDTVTLNLRYDGQVFRGQPELQALEEDFYLEGQQRSQQFRSINGRTESFTQWVISLKPKRTGTLTIPSIDFKGAQSNPIELQVLAESAAAKYQTAKDFFFESKLTPAKNPYVQSQVIYNEKLFYAENHNDANLSELKVTDARVQPLAEIKQYTTTINGRRFGVYERNYAIFPETTDNLVIPGQHFNAIQANPYDRWSRGKAISVTSKPLKLKVKAIPATYPKQAPWLPASQLQISESFSRDLNHWQAGEAVTRTIRIQAQGLGGKQLPDIELTDVAGLRYYPDQAHHSEAVSEQGIQGELEQSIAIVAAQGGTYELPELHIHWWNTRSNKLETAVLPAHTIKVEGAAVSPSTTASAPTTQIATTAKTDTVSVTHATTINYWGWLSGLGLLLSLGLNLYLLLRPKASSTTAYTPTPRTYDGWKALVSACKQNQAVEIRSQLLNWINQAGLKHIHLPCQSLAALATQVHTPALALALRELDSLLYSQQENSAFNGQNLLNLLKEEKKHKIVINKNDSVYPVI